NVARMLDSFHRRLPMPAPSAEISAERQVCALSHMSLWRDIYYTNRDSMNAPHWAVPDREIALGPDEFFVLGDNSTISGDARYWTNTVNLPEENLSVQGGRVPGRFM